MKQERLSKTHSQNCMHYNVQECRLERFRQTFKTAFSEQNVLETQFERFAFPTIACRGRAASWGTGVLRSEEHTSELQSLMRISYAVFCLKKKKQHNKIDTI